MKISATRLLLVLIGLAIGLFLLQLLGPNPAIVVSPQTTYLTTPLAADGLPDYATFLLDQQRTDVTPENNAAVPFIEAMWPLDLEPQQQQLVCNELGIPVPLIKGLQEPYSWGHEPAADPTTLETKLLLLTNHGIQPDRPINSLAELKAWTMEWQAQQTEGDAAGEPLNFEFAATQQSPAEALVNELDDIAYDVLSQCEDKPWTANQLPPLAAWVERNANNFELLREAARRPKYYYPSPSLLEDPNASLFSMSFLDIQSFRTAIRSLSTQAMLHAGEKRYAEAWADCQAMHRLTDHVPQQTLIGHLVLIACHSIARNAALELLDAPDLPADVAARMHRFYQSQTPRREMHKALDVAERLSLITTALNISGDRAPKDGATLDDWFDSSLYSLSTQSSVDWNIVLEDMNAWYDEMAAAMKQVDYNKRQAALSALDAKINAIQLTPGAVVGGVFSRSARSAALGDVFPALFLSALSDITAAEDRHNALLQLLQVAAGLAVHRANTGAYPDALEALVPELLAKLPVDAYQGQPLVYQKTKRGYLLYNVGPNGIDDGGMNETLLTYKGYQLDSEGDEAAARELLDEPVPEGTTFDASELSLDDWQNLAPTLDSQIPEGSDDWSIRLPRLPADWSKLRP